MSSRSQSTEEAQILSVLDAIATNNDASQRELSRATGLNVAKVNHLLKKLVEKGCLKLRNVSRNPNKLGYLYILTPTGITEKSRLTIGFARRTWMAYSKSLEKLRQSLVQLREEGANRLILLGANEVTDMVLDVVDEETELEVVAVVDPDGETGTHKGIELRVNADGLQFDRAVSCEQVGIEELEEKYGISQEELWLV